jgi:hypothetical protein
MDGDIMDDSSQVNELKDDLRLLTNKVDALVKIAEVCCEYLNDKDSDFEKVLEKKLSDIFK